MADTDYAFVVAINKYQHADAWGPLVGPKYDAGEFVKWLRTIGKVPGKHIVKIIRDDGRSPTYSELMSATRQLRKHAGVDEPIGRRLYIYLAGHGLESIQQAVRESVLVTAEADEDMPMVYSGHRALNYFITAALFDEVVLFMDCCRHVDRFGIAPSWTIKPEYDAAAVGVRTGIALATKVGRDAREQKIDGVVQGVFTHALLDGLRNAVDRNGRVTGATLTQHLRRALKGKQDAELHLDPELVFAINRTVTPVTVTVTLSPNAAKLEVKDGQDFSPVPIQPKKVKKGVVTIALAPFRTYLIQTLDADGRLLQQRGLTVEKEAQRVEL